MPAKGRLQPRARRMAEEEEACPELRPCHSWLAHGVQISEDCTSSERQYCSASSPTAHAHQENQVPEELVQAVCLQVCLSLHVSKPWVCVCQCVCICASECVHLP